jgi:uncharacterized protein YfbU (UPF0304 family)
MLTLDENEVKGLFDYLNDQPAKFSVPLMNFFNTLIQKQNQKEPQEQVEGPTPDSSGDKEAAAPKKRGVVKRLRNIEVNEPENVSKNGQLNT